VLDEDEKEEYDDYDAESDELENMAGLASKLFKTAVGLQKTADEIMDMYIKIRETSEVEDTPEAREAKKVFDEAERVGEHKKLVFKFHDLVYELVAGLSALAQNEEELFNLQYLKGLADTTGAAFSAYAELRESGAYYAKLTQDRIAALEQ